VIDIAELNRIVAAEARLIQDRRLNEMGIETPPENEIITRMATKIEDMKSYTDDLTDIITMRNKEIAQYKSHREHLDFIYSRLDIVHGENVHVDYMVKLGAIIKDLA